MVFRKSIVLSLLIGLLALSGLAGSLPVSVQAAPLASLPAVDAFGYTPTATTLVVLPADVCSSGTVIFSGTENDTEGLSALISPAGFSFPFYEGALSGLYVSINGLIATASSTANIQDQLPLPSDVLPDGLIAPYWTDLTLAGGQVCYRDFTEYLAFEWKNVETSAGTPITFQALLYPNGDIQYQYYGDPLPALDGVTLGIEDNKGIFGMQFHADESGPIPEAAILIQYPGGDHAGARFAPAYASGFLIQHEAELKINLENITGIDNVTFELDIDHPDAGCGWSLPAGWEITFFDGDSPLDTNSGCPVTPPLLAGETKEFRAVIHSPEALEVGDYGQFPLTALPVGTAALPVSIDLQAAVPANFTQVYKDPSQAINLNQTWKGESTLSVAGDLLYYGANLAMIRTTGGNYFITWEYQTGKSRIKGTLLGRDGSNIVSDFMITLQTVENDSNPALAALPNGSTAVVWARGTGGVYIRNYSASALPLFAETSLNKSSCTRLSAPQVAALSNSKLFVVWGCDYPNRDIYLNVVTVSGDQVSDQIIQVTLSDAQYEYYNPQVLALDDGTALISYIRKQKASDPVSIDPFYFTVYAEDGSLVQAQTGLPAGTAIPAQRLERDAAQLAPGIVLAGWTNSTAGNIEYAILSNVTGSWTADSVKNISLDYQLGAEKLSITNDANGNGVFTWLEAKKNSTLNYALVSPDGEILTPAMVFFSGSNSVTLDTSATGQGNAPYDPNSYLYIPLVTR